MGVQVMGKVLVAATIENLDDLVLAQQGIVSADQVRRLEVTDAIVDTGVSTLSMPKRYVAQIGLKLLRTRKARTPAGLTEVRVFGTARVTIQGRDCPCDVVEVSDDCPILIGQIPLEAVDWVVDPARQRLIGNPEHGGEQIIELY